MNRLAIIYHSAHGHTEHIAWQIGEGAHAVADTQVHLLRADLGVDQLDHRAAAVAELRLASLAVTDDVGASTGARGARIGLAHAPSSA